MLSSRVLIAGKYARKDVGKQGLGIVRTRKTCKNSRFCVAGVRSKTEKPHKTPGFMVYSQEGAEFIGICSTSYTSTKTQNPDSRVFCCISVEGSVFLVLMPERTPAKTRGFVVCECGEVLQYIRKTLRFTVYLQQRSKFTGIHSTSYTPRKRRLPIVVVVGGFGVYIMSSA